MLCLDDRPFHGWVRVLQDSGMCRTVSWRSYHSVTFTQTALQTASGDTQ